MQDIRCGSCSALLFRAGQGAIANAIEIKCRRCGTVNHLRPAEPVPDRRERPRKHLCGSTFPLK
ncbi:Com family DNA-binding transcriptional regulator [Ensifer soli]|uniref:Com family DNA-binding transcriptional regulator n=1 Tax=Ciceribacter sp. sgz301302 TaxID=3342379 RepID=UPI0035B9EE48